MFLPLFFFVELFLFFLREQFISTAQTARLLNISTRTLNKITATVTFEPGSYNFGLQLKFSGKNKQVSVLETPRRNSNEFLADGIHLP